MSAIDDFTPVEELERWSMEDFGRPLTYRQRADALRLQGAPPEAPLHLIRKVYSSDETLTPEEQDDWNAYSEHVEAWERKRDLLGLVDLAEVMRDGATAPTMLVGDLLVESASHTWFGTKGSFKTWMALYAVAQLLAQERTVVWVDKEMGRRDIADRLLTLGVPADLVEQRLVYCEHPTLDRGKESVTTWRAMLQEREPVLVVVDAQTEVLADADLNENSGTDVGKWTQSYLTPALRCSSTSVITSTPSWTPSPTSAGWSKIRRDASGRSDSVASPPAPHAVGICAPLERGEEPLAEEDVAARLLLERILGAARILKCAQ